MTGLDFVRSLVGEVPTRIASLARAGDSVVSDGSKVGPVSAVLGSKWGPHLCGASCASCSSFGGSSTFVVTANLPRPSRICVAQKLLSRTNCLFSGGLDVSDPRERLTMSGSAPFCVALLKAPQRSRPAKPEWSRSCSEWLAGDLSLFVSVLQEEAASEGRGGVRASACGKATAELRSLRKVLRWVCSRSSPVASHVLSPCKDL